MLVGQPILAYYVVEMAKSELKTKETEASVEKFLNSVVDEQQQADSRAVVDMMRQLSKEEPKMWGTGDNRVWPYDTQV